jgi:hypothetical protein
MLAFDAGFGVGCNATLTTNSLLIAILITGVGLFIALSKACRGRRRAIRQMPLPAANSALIAFTLAERQATECNAFCLDVR